MSWKIRINSDKCVHKDTFFGHHLARCEKNNLDPCKQSTCPLKPMSEEEAEKLVDRLIQNADKRGSYYERNAVGQHAIAIIVVERQRKQLIAALTGKEKG